jgi:hypothetical protein
MITTAKDLVKNLINQSEFYTFINNNNTITKESYYKMLQFLSICGVLNDNTFDDSMNSMIIFEEFKLNEELVPEFKKICNVFRTLYKEHNLKPVPSGPNMIIVDHEFV